MRNTRLNTQHVDQFFLSIFDSSPKAISILKVDKAPVQIHIQYCNEAFAHLIHREKQTVIGKDLTDLSNEIESSALYKAAYDGERTSFDRTDTARSYFHHVTILPSEEKGYCLCLIEDTKVTHDRNEERENALKKALFSLEQDKKYLQKLSEDYTAVYFIDPITDSFEVLKLADQSNACKVMDRDNSHHLTFHEFTDLYVNTFIEEKERANMRKWLDSTYLMHLLRKQEKVTFHYTSYPNEKGQCHFEIHAFRIDEKEEKHAGILLAFRYIDEIIQREKKRQEVLQNALNEVRLSNEIISSIGSIYFAIFRIDLARDYYEEISSDSEVHKLTGKEGKASEKLQEICNVFVSDIYYIAVKKFFDLSTLPERLKEENTVATEYLAKDGNWHLARFIVKKKDSQGNVTHVLYVTRLISDTKRREQNLIIEAEEAKRANQKKTDFMSRITHDIRTPLNVIKGFTDIGRNNLDNKEKILDIFNKMDTANAYLQSLVDNILDLNAMESGKISVQKQKTDIPSFFNEFTSSMQVLKPEKQLHFHFDMHDLPHPYLLIDTLHIKQIYANLLTNAINYTPKSGDISFSLSEEKDNKENTILLVARIADSGIGMSEEYMQIMYTRYTRAVDTRINAIRGSGLGLSVVKELVQTLHGTIEAKSKLGKGTTFLVKIPAEIVSSVNDTEIVDMTSSIQKCRGMHLLVAEDNALNFEIVQELLKTYDIESTNAANGKICLDMLKNSEKPAYDAILMDMQMPVMDGISCTKAIRSLHTNYATHVPIIALTANAFQSDMDRCLKAGMNAHISKPFNIKELIVLLASYR